MNDEDHCVYIKRSDDKFAILSLYVNGILIVGNHKEYVMVIKGWLSKNFNIKDMGETDCILRVKIKRDHLKKLLALSQENYIKKHSRMFPYE